MTVNSGYNDLIDEFSDVFGEIGCLDKEYHIEVDPDVTPTVNPPRKIPTALKMNQIVWRNLTSLKKFLILLIGSIILL